MAGSIGKTSTYSVVKGDSLWKIAKNNGVDLQDLISANPEIKDPNKIEIGQNINIPSSTAAHSQGTKNVVGGNNRGPNAPTDQQRAELAAFLEKHAGTVYDKVVRLTSGPIDAGKAYGATVELVSASAQLRAVNPRAPILPHMSNAQGKMFTMLASKEEDPTRQAQYYKQALDAAQEAYKGAPQEEGYFFNQWVIAYQMAENMTGPERLDGLRRLTNDAFAKEVESMAKSRWFGTYMTDEAENWYDAVKKMPAETLTRDQWRGLAHIFNKKCEPGMREEAIALVQKQKDILDTPQKPKVLNLGEEVIIGDRPTTAAQAPQETPPPLLDDPQYMEKSFAQIRNGGFISVPLDQWPASSAYATESKRIREHFGEAASDMFLHLTGEGMRNWDELIAYGKKLDTLHTLVMADANSKTASAHDQVDGIMNYYRKHFPIDETGNSAYERDQRSLAVAIDTATSGNKALGNCSICTPLVGYHASRLGLQTSYSYGALVKETEKYIPTYGMHAWLSISDGTETVEVEATSFTIKDREDQKTGITSDGEKITQGYKDRTMASETPAIGVLNHASQVLKERDSNQYATVIGELENAIETDPLNSALYIKSAEVYRAMKNSEWFWNADEKAEYQEKALASIIQGLTATPEHDELNLQSFSVAMDYYEYFADDPEKRVKGFQKIIALYGEMYPGSAFGEWMTFHDVYGNNIRFSKLSIKRDTSRYNVMLSDALMNLSPSALEPTQWESIADRFEADFRAKGSHYFDDLIERCLLNAQSVDVVADVNDTGYQRSQ